MVKRNLSGVSTESLVQELYERGVGIDEVFGFYYELGAIADARYDAIFGDDEAGQHGDPNRFGTPKLTVGDARLVGYGEPAGHGGEAIKDSKEPLGSKEPF